MAFNVAVDGLIGLVPFAGDVFDAAWKANLRNYQLLEEHIENPRRVARSSRALVALLIAGLVVFICLTAAGAFFVMRHIWQAVS
jgi:hypothetical protein